jgi:ribonuclease-3
VVTAPDSGRVDRAVLTRALGVVIDPPLLEQALTHRSYAYEHGGLPTNERLEFLGDAVLGLVVTDEIYLRFPRLPEGQLAKLRAAVVNMRALADVARGIDLGGWLLLGRGEESTGGRDKASILADTLEALIGATWLGGGLDESRPVVLRLIAPLIDAAQELGAGLDWKTSLQELAAGRGLGPPAYDVSERGPDHAKVFRATVRFGAVEHGSGEGRSKKEAEQKAAAASYESLNASRVAEGADHPPAEGPDAAIGATTDDTAPGNSP